MTTRNAPKGFGWVEPESAANEDTQPEYPYNNVTQTESGHSFELDDTPSRERVKLMHRTGTFIEMHPNGDEVHKVYGDGYEITIMNKNVMIKGDCTVTIEGDATTHIKGNKYERIDGDLFQIVNGNYELSVQGDSTISSKGSLSITSSPALGGFMDINCGGEIYISGDMSVEGTVRAGAVYSKTRVDAELGISAGPDGFVSLLGGLSIGIPIAVPGNITCIGIVSAGIEVKAPIGKFVMMDSVWMTDNLNKTLHNIHFHTVPKGLTSPPLVPMI